jgi:hypothetical protein
MFYPLSIRYGKNLMQHVKMLPFYCRFFPWHRDSPICVSMAVRVSLIYLLKKLNNVSTDKVMLQVIKLSISPLEPSASAKLGDDYGIGAL